MTGIRGPRIEVVSDTPLVSAGIRISTGGDIFVHNGVSESQVGIDNTEITAQEQGAAANSPTPATGANPFATLADLPSAGGAATGGGSETAAGSVSQVAIGINQNTFANFPTAEEIGTASEGLVAYWDGNCAPILFQRNGGNWQAMGVPSCDGQHVMFDLRPNEDYGVFSRIHQNYREGSIGTPQTKNMFGYRGTVGGSTAGLGQPDEENSGFFVLNTAVDPSTDSENTTNFKLTIAGQHPDPMTSVPPFQSRPTNAAGIWANNSFNIASPNGSFHDQYAVEAGLSLPSPGTAAVPRKATGEFSHSIWIKRLLDFNTLPVGMTIDIFRPGTSGPDSVYAGGGSPVYDIVMSGSLGNGNRNIVRHTGGSLHPIDNVAEMQPDVWHNLIVTLNDVTGFSKWYWDGVLVDTFDYTSTLDGQGLLIKQALGAGRGIVGEMRHVDIGPRIGSGPSTGAGTSDLMRFTGIGYWNRELTQADVTAIYGDNGIRGESYHLQKTPLAYSIMNTTRDHPNQVTGH